MKKTKGKNIFRDKRVVVPLIIIFIAVLAVPAVARAGVISWIAGGVGQTLLKGVTTILMLLINLLGRLLSAIVVLLVAVAQYNDFINAPAVTRGWIIIRDACNMFFIIVLLVIAFCTALQIEKYSYKRLLGELILAAVLVNFSRLICGLIIDVGQVFMLAFVNAFKDAAAGNFVNLLGIEELLSIPGAEEAAKEPIGQGEIFISAFFAFVLSLISVAVVGVMFLILVARIIVLWLLVIFFRY